MKRNKNLARLKGNYLFPEIQWRKKQFLEQHPHAELISLGIGDTTEPLPVFIANSLAKASTQLATLEGYSGYGPEQGQKLLREKIALKIYSNLIDPGEIFVSDGAKCDIGRFQMLFGNKISIAVQDPAYPVYIEGSLIQGVKKIISLPCTPENQFFPDLQSVKRTDLIYFCSPNNPTGAAATRAQLKNLVRFAESNGSIIIYDSAYASYIQDPSIPTSIFEIEGAKKVAIEISSFSKLAGFTGVRLGWAVVPEELMYNDGTSVKADWNRLNCTIFNGASTISQAGGCAVLEEAGWQETSVLIKLYLENAKIIKQALEKAGHEVFGGVHAPYLWVRFKGQNSWNTFQQFLDQYHIVTTPGSGFGPGGEEYIRISAFGHRDNILKAAAKLAAG